MVSPDALEVIYRQVPWREAGTELGPQVLYDDKYPVLALLAAHTLPYFLPLISERALADELRERAQLREICGFGSGSADIVPNRGTLWHFRKRKLGFPVSLLKALYCLAKESWRVGASPPFATQDSHVVGEREGGGNRIPFTLPSLSTSGVFHLYGTAEGKELTRPRSEQLTLDALVCDTSNAVPARRIDLGTDLGFPVEVRASCSAGEERLILWRPPWLGEPYRRELATFGFQSGGLQYTAVNILVLDETRRRVLLAPRLTGFGAGSFTVPGGKVQPGETLIEAATRELVEETGLSLGEATPISRRFSRIPNGAKVRSVGVLATSFKGTVRLRRRERSQLGEWDWHDLHHLPRPMFEPAAWVIEDYHQQDFSSMTWGWLDEGEEQVLPLWTGSAGE